MVLLALLTPFMLLAMMFALDAFEGFLFPPPAAHLDTPSEDRSSSPDLQGDPGPPPRAAVDVPVPVPQSALFRPVPDGHASASRGS
jgi:hypothetical protein